MTLPPYPPGSRFDAHGNWRGFRCRPDCEACAAERWLDEEAPAALEQQGATLPPSSAGAQRKDNK